MRVIMSGGGTGGHIYPAIAIADTIKSKYPDAEIIFTGNKGAMEESQSVAAGYKFVPIECKGFVRSLSPKNIKVSLLALTSPIEGRKLIKDFKPDIVIGTGGYVCWPTLAAASCMKIPTAIHESNSIPGLAVKILSKMVDRVWVNYENVIDSLGNKRKIVRVGNPLRKAFDLADRESALKSFSNGKKYTSCILAFGGSLGAEEINKRGVSFIREYIASHPELLYIHITGKKGYDSCLEELKASGLDTLENVRLLAYSNDMPTLMAAADVIVSRAGALTLSELALVGRAAVLIPSPNVVANHQYFNAKALADKGAAILIEEKDLSSKTYADTIDLLIGNKEKREELERKIKEFSVEDSKEKILEEIEMLLKSKKKK